MVSICFIIIIEDYKTNPPLIITRKWTNIKKNFYCKIKIFNYESPTNNNKLKHQSSSKNKSKSNLLSPTNNNSNGNFHINTNQINKLFK